MPKIDTPFVQLKTMFKQCAAQEGVPLSDRKAHRMTQGFLLSNAADECELQHSDKTGEEAVKEALLFYIRKYGSLRGLVAA